MILTRTQIGGEVLESSPNPGNPEVSISYLLDGEAQARVRIFNTVGQAVRTLDLESPAAGRHMARWDARDDQGQSVSSGTYLYRLEINGRPTPARKLSIVQ